MISEAISRGLFPFLPGLHGLSAIQALNSSLTSPPPPNQSIDRPNAKHRCNLCGFESDQVTEYESHLNSHFDHRCPYCDYTSKTEGRLRRHVKDFHKAPSSADIATTSLVSSGPGSQHSESDDSSSLQNALCNGGSAGSAGTGQQKPRISKCKTCGFVAETKTEFWEHSKMHIKQGKMLECPQCPFVTEYKHHLEYHLRNHFGSKPFKCAKCNYSCVNKSMLNSHMKSHSNVYQYRCEDCNYATKYCHSLKLHLRKYGHKPAVVLNPDGTPNPYPIIDVYGTRRGPRPKKAGGGSREGAMNSLPDSVAGRPLPLLQTPLADVASLLRNTGNWMNFPFGWPPTVDSPEGQTPSSNVLGTDLSLLTSHIPGQTLLCPEEDSDRDCDAVQTQLGTSILSEIRSSIGELPAEPKNAESTDLAEDLGRSPASTMPTPDQSENDVHPLTQTVVKTEPVEWNMEDVPLDLSRSAPHSPVRATSSSPDLPANRSSPLNDLARLPPADLTDTAAKVELPQTPEPVRAPPPSTSSSSRRKGRAVKLETFQCDFCDMLFKDADMFSIHMNYHGFEDPFKCHVCGLQTANRLDFFVHLTRDPHN